MIVLDHGLESPCHSGAPEIGDRFSSRFHFPLAQCLPQRPMLEARTVQKIEADDITILVNTLQRLRAALGCEWKRLLG